MLLALPILILHNISDFLERVTYANTYLISFRKEIDMAEKIKVAIVGPGNIGIDLMEKIIKRGQRIELSYMAGLYADSNGIQKAKEHGIEVTIDNLDRVLKDKSVKLIFDATSASSHLKNAPDYIRYKKIAIDLTPAAIGPHVVPVINLDQHLD